ncbi:glycosyltransferase family 2 protein [Rhodobaculum claviforme]|uniref:Glucosyl transferase n=1 Tax=Rhodobaculum claviforme TaxID=1549854 RepID=A0A934THY4_9RHOB|nr:glycosyltransferase family A protein [Rhodobaculum claviforme]MBK5925901.1 glucosyl transferase [Rhodobaculum claviforme]
MPRASIVVPAYNAAATLGATLESLVRQTLGDFEVVVVDDGSSDATGALVRQLGDPRVRLVRQNNRGLAGARNTGIAHARGAFIGFCDADDLWQPRKLAAHVAHLEANPQVGLSYAGSAFIDAAGRPTGHVQRPRLRGITAAHVFKRNPVGNGSAPVMRRAALDAIAWRPAGETARDWWFDESFRQSEDIECWLRLALTTDWEIAGIPGALTLYRLSAGGLSANTDAQLASWERMVAKLSPLAPAFFDRHAPAARAYQLRYLSRRAISARDGARAAALALRGARQSLRPLWEEPSRTLVTWGAAAVLGLAGPERFATTEARLLRRAA